MIQRVANGLIDFATPEARYPVPTAGEERLAIGAERPGID
jgi:hypothetical protein